MCVDVGLGSSHSLTAWVQLLAGPTNEWDQWTLIKCVSSLVLSVGLLFDPLSSCFAPFASSDGG